jgi:hypothetical protein
VKGSREKKVLRRRKVRGEEGFGKRKALVREELSGE